MLASNWVGRVRPQTFALTAALAVLPGLLPAAAPRGRACSYPAYPSVMDLPGCVLGRTTLPPSIPGNTVFYVPPTVGGVALPLAADRTIAGWADLPAPRTITTACGPTTLAVDADDYTPDAAGITAATNHRAPESSRLDCAGTPKCGGVDSFTVEVLVGHDQLTPDANLTYLVFTGDDAASVGAPGDLPVAETVASSGTLGGLGLLDTYVAVRVVDFAGHVSARSNVFRVNR